MSLTSFLLGAGSSVKKKSIDKDLDALFQSQVSEDGPSRSVETRTDQNQKKAKEKRTSKQHNDEPEPKRHKPSLPDTRVEPSRPRRDSDQKSRKGAVKKHVIVVSPGPESDQESSEAEEPGLTVDHAGSSGSAGENEDGPSNIVHESLRANGKNSKKRISDRRKQKYAPPDETQEQRDARTIFIGNLSPEIAQKRPLLKQFHRHILALIPTARIESTRFRSVAFQTPTSKLPSEVDSTNSKKKARQHDRDRASTWRETNTSNEPSKADEKKYLTPSEKKKIAFINHDIHSNADSVHAYIVFAHPQPANSRPANLPPAPPVMDPFEAARLAVEKGNGTIFLDRMLRVDFAFKPSAEVSSKTVSNGPVGDPKLTIFVGNLDFASKEEDLRVFFESIVTAERGPPESSSESDKLKHWVTRVRMIRDKDTQLGKGFAYVQFADRTCVDEILALEPGKLKFAKRKLRVQRCKTIPGAPVAKITSPTKPSRPAVSEIPKGDPSLGEKLAGLSKEERKQAKAADTERLARRMAKKKARMTLANKGVPIQGKERERVRKKSTVRKAGSNVPQRKTRVRSEKSLAKRNIKK